MTIAHAYVPVKSNKPARPFGLGIFVPEPDGVEVARRIDHNAIDEAWFDGFCLALDDRDGSLGHGSTQAERWAFQDGLRDGARQLDADREACSGFDWDGWMAHNDDRYEAALADAERDESIEFDASAYEWDANAQVWRDSRAGI